ncbi:NAD/NADP octopine/nopaline dehydrogenase family protein [Crassaminicella thermophila]|uniref:NAD/NADP octopine/nopaline dehydrogenase family protein n=1 Tax=Crassaminicella thermophila TaxID=2599308 RepID=UPI00143CC283|nr:NAD/NADP-dependent octopine/nopaline dehydrogenase family protein [Crassaminicella thermophila]
MNNKNLKWTIIGGGNGGQSVAGHLGLMGFSVKLYDIIPETVEKINEQGGIFLEGIVNGFGKVELATNNIEEALKDTDIIMIIVPSLAHKEIAKMCAPHLVDGQIVFLHPGATFGALAFHKIIEDEDCNANVIIAESNTLIYACRLIEPGRARILGVKDRILVAALPANETDRVVKILNAAYKEVEAAENVMVTSFDNTNPIVHPTTTLLCTGLVESNRDWLFYWDGFTPSIGSFLEELDQERIAVGNALGLNLITCKKQYELEYGVCEDTLEQAVKNTQAYAEIKGQHSLNTRYILEDIPMGLLPLASMGKLLGVPVERMETVIRFCEYFLHKDFSSNGRTVENLGLENMTADEIMEFVKTGKKLKCNNQ